MNILPEWDSFLQWETYCSDITLILESKRQTQVTRSPIVKVAFQSSSLWFLIMYYLTLRGYALLWPRVSITRLC